MYSCVNSVKLRFALSIFVFCSLYISQPMASGRPQLGIIFAYDSANIPDRVLKHVSQTLAWWNEPKGEDYDDIRETFMDEMWLGSLLAPQEDSPTTSREEPLSFFDSMKQKITSGAAKVKFTAQRTLTRTNPNKLAVMAAEHFFEPFIDEQYFDELDQKYKCYREIEWNIYYNKILDIAFDLESRLGTQTTISWAIRYLWHMPSRIRDGKNRLKLLLKIGFIWYNYTLELKYRYAVHEDEVMELYKLCRNVYMILMKKCEFADEDEDALIKLIDLVLAAISNRLEDINPNAEATLRKFVEDHGETCNQEKHLNIPEIIIALYFYEMALLEIKKECSRTAYAYLKTSLMYLFEQMKFKRKKNILCWQYNFGVVYDLIRLYCKYSFSDGALTDTMRFVKTNLKKYHNDNQTSIMIVLEFVLCTLSCVLQDPDDMDIIYGSSESRRESFMYGVYELQKCLIQSSVDSPLLNVYLLYSTFLLPDYTERRGVEVGNYLIKKIFDSNNKSLYGYKFIANLTFLFIAVQYHCHASRVVSLLSNAVLDRILEKAATPEVLCYMKFVKLFMSIISIYQKRWKDYGSMHYEEATKISIEHQALSEFASRLSDCIMQKGNSDKDRIVQFVNGHGKNTIERVLTSVAEIFYKNLSNEEIFKSLIWTCKYFRGELDYKKAY